MELPNLTPEEAYYDPNASPDANYQHLRYVFEGYRSGALGIDNPYSPGGARARSFDIGIQLFKKDSEPPEPYVFRLEGDPE